MKPSFERFTTIYFSYLFTFPYLPIYLPSYWPPHPSYFYQILINNRTKYDWGKKKYIMCVCEDVHTLTHLKCRHVRTLIRLIELVPEDESGEWQPFLAPRSRDEFEWAEIGTKKFFGGKISQLRNKVLRREKRKTAQNLYIISRIILCVCVRVCSLLASEQMKGLCTCARACV